MTTDPPVTETALPVKELVLDPVNVALPPLTVSGD
mgnify:CR=1 FL=1